MKTSGQALVIGGGPAGAALAAQLARAGRPVILLERENGPHDKVCGEFLSPEAIAYLDELELDLSGLGAVPIGDVRLAVGKRIARAPLPFSALSLSRQRLDEALLRAASAAGAQVRRGSRVRRLTREGDRWLAGLDDGAAISCAEVFLATGKHDLPGWKRPEGAQADLIGFKLHWRLAPRETAALGQQVELILFPGGYAGLEAVEGGLANLCLLVRRRRFAELGRTWGALLADIRAASPHLDRRLRGAEPCRNRPLAIAAIPYGHVRRDSDGPWRLGDQAAVIPSFCGDGVAIALHSARLAARCYLEGRAAAVYQRQLADDVSRQVWRATICSQMLVTRWGRIAAAELSHFLPRSMTALAAGTRISAAAVRRERMAGVVRSNASRVAPTEIAASQPGGEQILMATAEVPSR